MKKKSIIAMGLAGVLAVSMSMPVWADTTITAPGGGNTELTYNVAESYSITIPAAIDLSGDQAQTVAITGTGNIASGKKLLVTATAGVKENGEIILTAGGATAKAILKLGANAVANPSTTSLAEFVYKDGTDLNNTIADAITVAPPASAAQAGAYTGTVTFTISEGSI